jgi:hypothetical protein
MSICLSRLPRSIYDSNSETDLTGVAPEDGIMAVKYDHRQKARFDFYTYNILMDLASILFSTSKN